MADQFSPTPVKGLKTTNNAAPTNDNVGVLAAVANASAPTLTEGRQALLSTDLSGNLRVTLSSAVVDTELPAAAALADNTANPTVPGVGAYLMAYDGTDWDRVRLSGSLGSLNVAVTNTVTVDTELPAAAALADNTSNPTVPAVGAFNMVWDSTGTNWDRWNSDGSGNAKVSIANASVTVDTELPTAAALADNTANPTVPGVGSYLMAFDGTDWDRVRLDASLGALQVNAKQGTAAALTAPWPVRLSDGTTSIGTSSNPLVVTLEGAGAGTLVDTGTLTSSALAAGATTPATDLVTADITTSKTGKLLEITFSSSVRTKVEVGTWNGTTFTGKRVFFCEANQFGTYAPRDRDEITFAGGTGNKFRLRVTNMDNLNAADIYGTLTYEEV